MARGKRVEKNLTPEEKLEQALVPVEEQPYLVPGNWCWVQIGYLINILNGFAFKSELYEDKGIRIVRIANVRDGYIEDENPVFYPLSAREKIEKYMLAEGDVLLSLTGNVGRTAMLTSDMLPAALNQRVACIRCNNQDIDRHFLFYFFLRKQFRNECVKNSKGSAQLNMSTEWLKIQPLCVPPLSEQQRIVSRIESLLAKLDKAKEKAQAVVDGFEIRKAAILHKAFTGELTVQWRQKNNVGLDSWQRITIESLCHSLKYGTAKKSQDHGSVVVIRMGNLQHGEIDWTNLAYTDDKEDIEKYRLLPGDVLFNRTNSSELVGKTSIYRGEYPAIYAGYLIKLDYDHDQILGDYFNYVLNSTAAKEYCNAVKTDGVNQSNINAKKIGAFVIPVPTISEQNEIIRVVKSLFAKDQQAKEAAEAVLDQIETMKKAILARAFRGELGTNNPAEESAVELLKSTL